MGSIFESCKSSFDCCNDDNQGYIPIIPPERTKTVDTVYTEFTEIEEDDPNENIIVKHQSPWEIYEELEEIGRGTYGIVKKVRLISDHQMIRAMKIISEENDLQGKGASSIDEIKIVKKLDHINIMKVYEWFFDGSNYYIVSDFCDQGHLLNKLEKLGHMNEIVVKYLMKQIFNAVTYMHSKNILHGDIKLENILLYKTSNRGKEIKFTVINYDLNTNKTLAEDINENFGKNQASPQSNKYVEDLMGYQIKLIDFGCSKYFKKKNKRRKLNDIIGTCIYCSPEVVDNLYDERSDEWSCGVLMYILLSGVAPFTGDTEEEIFEKIKKCQYDVTPAPFKKVSKNC